MCMQGCADGRLYHIVPPVSASPLVRLAVAHQEHFSVCFQIFRWVCNGDDHTTLGLPHFCKEP